MSRSLREAFALDALAAEPFRVVFHEPTVIHCQGFVTRSTSYSILAYHLNDIAKDSQRVGGAILNNHTPGTSVMWLRRRPIPGASEAPIDAVYDFFHEGSTDLPLRVLFLRLQ